MPADKQYKAKGSHRAYSIVFHPEVKRLQAKGASNGKAKEGGFKQASAHVKAMSD